MMIHHKETQLNTNRNPNPDGDVGGNSATL